MKDFTVRTLAGAVYVVITLGSILAGSIFFAVFFTIVLAVTLFEFYRLLQHEGYKPHRMSGIVVALFLFVSTFLFSISMVSERIFLMLIPLVLCIPAIELFRKGEKKIQNISFTAFGILYIGLPFSLANMIVIPAPGMDYKPVMLIGLLIVLWAFDSGAYLFGRWLGKHKLLATVSPNKTWEGFAGGILFSSIFSVIFFQIAGYSTPLMNVLLAVLIGVSGTLGDFTESLIKRNCHEKDSGKLIPGHGGLLDRFDSLLFSLPVFYAFITLIK